MGNWEQLVSLEPEPKKAPSNTSKLAKNTRSSSMVVFLVLNV